MRVGVDTVSSGLDTNQSDRRVLDEVVEGSNSVGSTTDTSNNRVGQLARLLSELRLDLSADDPLEVSHDGGERVWANSGSDQVMRRVQSRNPFSHRLVDGILERLRSSRDRDNLSSVGYSGARCATHRSAKHSDSKDVKLLSSDVLGSHIDNTLHAELSADSSGGDTVLTGSRLGNDSLLS